MNRIRHQVLIPFLFVALAVSQTTAAETTPDAPVTECVGSHSISFPGDVTYALVSPTYFVSNADSPSEYTFPDNTPAPFSHLSIARGSLRVSTQIEDTRFSEVERAIDTRMKERQREVLQAGLPSQTLTKLAVNNGFVWIDNQGLTIRLLRNTRMYEYDSDTTANNETIRSLTEQLQARHIYETPSATGICIPYGYFTTNSPRPRHIAVSLQLTQHPDIEIYFKEKALTISPSSQRKIVTRSAKDEIRHFFDTDYYHFAPTAKADWRGFRSLKIDGRKGNAIFVTLIRPDGQTDYGYVACVKGDYNATEDTPDLMLYVIRTAARAKGAPVSKEELLSMAEQIVASIKHRPTR